MIGSRLEQGGGIGKVSRGQKGLWGAYPAFDGGTGLLWDSHNGNFVRGYFRKHLKFLLAYAGHRGYPYFYLFTVIDERASNRGRSR